MKRLRFSKEDNGRWYVELPEYPGPKGDLQMVAGADTMLDVIAGGNQTVTLKVSEQHFEDAQVLRLGTGYREEHGDYVLEKYENKIINHKMWLCPVITFVFGKLPRLIYFKSI